MTDDKTENVSVAPLACPHCRAESRGKHFCSECGRIQPVEVGTDYFSFFDLPRKLRPDEAELEKAFYSLSRQFHPDYFMNATEGERQSSMDRASMLNDAYRTLRDPVARARYLLSLYGYKEAEKKAPPDLLEEVFELNMQVEQLRAAKTMGDEAELAETRSALLEALAGLQEKLKEIDNRLFSFFDMWDAALDKGTVEPAGKATLESISQLLSHRSYVNNLVRDMKEEI